MSANPRGAGEVVASRAEATGAPDGARERTVLDRSSLTDPSAPTSLTDRIRARLSAEVGPDRCDRYLDARTRFDVREGALDVTVPNGFLADAIRRRFGEQLRRAAQAELHCDDAPELRILVEDAPAERRAAPPRATPAAAPSQAPTLPARRASPSRHRLEDFEVARSNALAHEAVVRAAAGDPSIRLLLIHGPCGVGKTHLLHAATARRSDSSPGAAVRCVSAEQFTNEYVSAVRANRIEPFRRTYRGLDMLCIDDVHLLATRQATQNELLHTLDAIQASPASCVVLASDAHPREVEKFSAAIRSRLLSGPVVEIARPEPELRVRLILKIARERGLLLEPAAVERLARESARGEGSVREIQGLVARVDAAWRLLGDGRAAVAAADLARILSLGEANPGPQRPLRPDVVLDAACRMFGVELDALKSRRRHPRLVLARALAIHAIRAGTTMSFPEIARALGRPNHSTIITAWQRVRRQIESELPADRFADVPASLSGRRVGDLGEQLIAESRAI